MQLLITSANQTLEQAEIDKFSLAFSDPERQIDYLVF